MGIPVFGSQVEQQKGHLEASTCDTWKAHHDQGT